MEGISQDSITPQLAQAAGPGRAHRWSLFAVLILPVTLWLVATLFLRGDLGKWNDDYFFLGQFNAATGDVRSYVLDRRLHFWRPVYRYVATPLITVFFAHDRGLHVISAVVHGLVCVGLYRLLRRFGLSWPAAGLGAMFLLVYPAGYEVPFWNTCNFTGVTTGVLLWAAAVYMNWLDGRHRLPAWALIAVMTGLGFLAAGINEQPSAAVVAFPVLGLGAVWMRRGVARPMWPGLIRAAIPVMAAAAGVGVYLWVQLSMFPMRVGHGIGSKIPLADLPGRFRDLYGSVLSDCALRGVKQDALMHGWRALAAEPWLSIPAAMAMLVGAGLWLRAAQHGRVDEKEAGGTRDTRWIAVIGVFGVAWFVACWLPIARIAYPTSPRLFYAPSAGIAMALAALLELWVFGVQRARLRRWVVGGATIAVLVAFAVMMVGIQRGYQTRWHADEQQARELKGLVPNPPRGAVFVPIRVVDRPLVGAKGEPNSFTRRFQAPLRSEWAGGWWVQRAYWRADVFAAQAIGPWDRVPLEAGPPTDRIKDARGTARLSNPLMPPSPQRIARPLSWDRIVPFEVDETGRVRVFTRVAINRPDGTRDELVPKGVEGVAERQGAEQTLEVSTVRE